MQPSPSLLVRVSFTPTTPCFLNDFASHTKRSKPWSPPWRLLGPLFASSVYVLPSSVNLALAIRLP